MRKGASSRGKGGGKGKSGGSAESRLITADAIERGSGSGRGGKGTRKAKVGETRDMGGVILVAVNKDGRIAWEPIEGIDNMVSRDGQRRAVQDETQWLKDQEAAIKDQRVAE